MRFLRRDEDKGPRDALMHRGPPLSGCPCELVTVGNGDNGDAMRFADVDKHIARHGLKAEVKQIAADVDVASAILSRAADSSADFIVMGGYGHSRLREFILGGVTRGILGAMTVPVLMSH